MFSAIFYKEKVNKLVILGILFATIGGILVALSAHCTLSFIKPACDIFADGQSSTNSVGNLLAFLGALFAAGYLILGKTVRKSVPLVPYAFIVYLTSAVILTVLVILYSRPVIFYKPNTYIYFVLVAVFPQLIGHSILNWALKYLSTTYVSIAQMGEPVGSTILAIFIFREIPTTLKIIGAIFILAGIFVASRPTTKN
jgi:drug/metabolite transporter (DMT)-like permease